MNLLHKNYSMGEIIVFAHEKNEILTLFKGGKEDYNFVTKHNYHEGINNVSSILIGFQDVKEKVNPNKIILTLIKDLLEEKEDVNSNLYILVNILFWYYYHKSEKNLDFDLDINKVKKICHESLLANEKSLKEDNRWAGNENNSKNGLWDPMMRLLKGVKERYNGVDIMND